MDIGAITEAVSYSWYQQGGPLHPAAGQTAPQYPKADAYSWLKAPRYQGRAYEVGPLARMWVNGDYSRGISVLDRHAARAAEALKVAEAMQQWLPQLSPGGAVYAAPALPSAGPGVGLTEAPRGALGHWVSLAGGTLGHYQVITPTCWNASPRDDDGVLGPIEQALIGTPVGNVDEPIEVLRVIHSFDPCLACAVHVTRPRGGVVVRTLELAGT
jgi:hydrogenase large subunit